MAELKAGGIFRDNTVNLEDFVNTRVTGLYLHQGHLVRSPCQLALDIVKGSWKITWRSCVCSEGLIWPMLCVSPFEGGMCILARFVAPCPAGGGWWIQRSSISKRRGNIWRVCVGHPQPLGQTLKLCQGQEQPCSPGHSLSSSRHAALPGPWTRMCCGIQCLTKVLSARQIYGGCLLQSKAGEGRGARSNTFPFKWVGNSPEFPSPCGSISLSTEQHHKFHLSVEVKMFYGCPGWAMIDLQSYKSFLCSPPSCLLTGRQAGWEGTAVTSP